jgi:hypothetical protein
MLSRWRVADRRRDRDGSGRGHDGDVTGFVAVFEPIEDPDTVGPPPTAEE